MKLSVCLAVFNEEKNIHYPLDSAYDLADEVIIVDGGSTDRTVEIAKSYGPKVKIFHETNPPMFHINKQKAIERAKGEWILQLDADEALSPELKKEIIQLLNGSIVSFNVAFNQQSNNRTIERLNTQLPVAYWLPRKNWFLCRFLMKGGQYPDYTIRLYRNGVARFPCKDVHENVIISSKFKVQSSKLQSKNQKEKNNLAIEQLNNRAIGYLKNPILHYADPTFSRYLFRWHRYNNLDAALLKKTIEQSSNQTIRKLWLSIDYLFVKPFVTFFLIYFRHKGFLDGWPGFVFAFFSSIRFWEIYFILFRQDKK